MKYDLRSACLSRVLDRTAGSAASRRPRPRALGWKLENGMIPIAEVNALCESMRGAAPALPCWSASGPLRAFLDEYHAVRREAGHRRKRPRRRRTLRPADCA